MKSFAILFVFLLTTVVFGQPKKANHESAHETDREQVRPILAPMITPKIMIPATPPLCNIVAIEIPIFGDAKCFGLNSLDDSCNCLMRESLAFQNQRKGYDEKIKKIRSEMHAKYMKDQAESAGAVEDYQAVVNAVHSGDNTYTNELLGSVESSKNRNFKRGRDLFVSKDKGLTDVSNEYMAHIEKYDACIPFAEFSFINALPKKSFIKALNDPKLRVEDFTESHIGTDEETRARRTAIKDFMLFNPEWELAFKAGDKQKSFEAVKKIYKSVDAEKIYRSTTNNNERRGILNDIAQEKKDFFKDQHLGKKYSRLKGQKGREIRESIEYVLDKENQIDGNEHLLDKVVRFKGYPSLEECKSPRSNIEGCIGTYTNYCNVKKENKPLTDEEYQKLERAFEVLDDGHYIADRYKEVTQRYCDKKLRIGDTSKINGTLPTSMSFLEFKKGLCEDKTFSIKGQLREIYCKKNHALLSLFANEVVDGDLIAKDNDADFPREFLQLYSNVEVTADKDLTDLAKVAVQGGKSDSKGDGVFSRIKERVSEIQSEGFSSIFGEDDGSTPRKVKTAAIVPEQKTVTKNHHQSSDGSAQTTTEEVLAEATKVVDQVVGHQTNISGATLSPEVARSYSIPPYIAPTMAPAEIAHTKTEVDTQVEKLERRINSLSEESETREEANRRKEIAGLEKELASLKDYSKSIERLLDEKEISPKTQVAEIGNTPKQMSSSLANLSDASASYVSGTPNTIPSRVYEDHFADANFHHQTPAPQSALINRQISEASGSNEALMSVYTNQSVKAMLDRGESSGNGNFVLMASPIEITESSESKFARRELQVDQIFIEELRAHPEKLKAFFEERKIEHVGLLTLKSPSNTQMSYMVRKDEQGKLLVIPVNIARKSKLDDLRRTLQVKAFGP